MANLNQLSCTRLIISNTDKTTLRNTETSPDTRARTPHKGTASRDPQLNCPEISENYPPTIILANKKQRKVPVLHAVNDKNKKIKLYPIHKANWWNVGFANSAKTSYWFPKSYHIFKLR